MFCRERATPVALILKRTAGLRPAPDHDAGGRPAVRKTTRRAPLQGEGYPARSGVLPAKTMLYKVPHP